MLRLTETRGSRWWPASRHAVAEGVDLLRLLDVERLAALVELQGRRLHVHAQPRRPCRGRVRGGAPPDPVAQAGRMRLEAQQTGRIREHRARVGLRKPLARQQLQKDLGMPAGHVAVVLALARHVAEVAEAVDHLLRRAAADAQLQPPAGDHVGRAGVLDHVERVLVAHVDHRRADLDPAGAGADGRQQRERRGQLLGEVVHAEVGAVRAELLGRHRQLDRLQQRIRRRPRLRVRRRRPMAEGQEPDALHGSDSIGGSARTCWTVDSTA